MPDFAFFPSLDVVGRSTDSLTLVFCRVSTKLDWPIFLSLVMQDGRLDEVVVAVRRGAPAAPRVVKL